MNQETSHGEPTPATAKSQRPEECCSERIRTNECLEEERQKSDEEYKSAQKPIEDQSALVKEASLTANRMLEAARNQAKSRLEAAYEEAREVVNEERARTDAILRQERTAVDVSHPKIQKARDHSDQVLRDAHALSDARLEDMRAVYGHSIEGEGARMAQTLREEEYTAYLNHLKEHRRRDILLAHLLHMERSETNQKLLLERARADRSVMMRDEFLGMVSHDIRGMLATITLSVEMLVKAASEDDAEKHVPKWALMIDDAAARIERLVGDLMDIARIELGKLSVYPSPQNAVSVLTDVMDAFRAAALKKGISLEVEPAEGEVLAMFDRDRILQVLGNLASNAIKFSNPGGTVMIRLEPSADFIRFSVRDNGAGIPGDQLESVFERFWQGAENDRRGIGLGLFISKNLIDAHGGRIWATSKLGVGSTFYFTLPTVPGEPPSPERHH